MTPLEHCELILEHIPELGPVGRRFVVAVAGPPAGGKSTVAEALVEALDGRAALVAMDGFHFDNVILDERGHRSRKGAPHTFDTGGFGVAIEALRSDRSLEMAVPVFDRELDIARNCASVVSSSHDILVTEGNYLLLDQEPWSALRSQYDLTVWLDVPLDVVEVRVVSRWESAGLDAAEIHRRAAENDLPNARLVHTGSVTADLVLST